jgi:predicted cupin superfamily sugar epimerase
MKRKTKRKEKRDIIVRPPEYLNLKLVCSKHPKGGHYNETLRAQMMKMRLKKASFRCQQRLS